jgi:hypothetical protein
MVRRLTNSIRPGVLASFLAKGEAQTSPHVLHHARDGRAKSSTLMRRVKAMDEGHKVVGDGTSRRLQAVTGDTQPQEVKRMGVRASIRALKRGNARGAKGGRKAYVQ